MKLFICPFPASHFLVALFKHLAWLPTAHTTKSVLLCWLKHVHSVTVGLSPDALIHPQPAGARNTPSPPVSCPWGGSFENARTWSDGRNVTPASGSHPPSPTFSLSAQFLPCQNQKLSVWVWLQQERNKTFEGMKEVSVMIVLFQRLTLCLWTSCLFPLPMGLPHSLLPRKTLTAPPEQGACWAALCTSLLLCAP